MDGLFPHRLECIPFDGKANCDGNLGHPEIFMQEQGFWVAAHHKPELNSRLLFIKALVECWILGTETTYFLDITYFFFGQPLTLNFHLQAFWICSLHRTALESSIYLICGFWFRDFNCVTLSLFDLICFIELFPLWSLDTLQLNELEPWSLTIN